MIMDSFKKYLLTFNLLVLSVIFIAHGSHIHQGKRNLWYGYKALRISHRRLSDERPAPGTRESQERVDPELLALGQS